MHYYDAATEYMHVFAHFSSMRILPLRQCECIYGLCCVCVCIYVYPCIWICISLEYDGYRNKKTTFSNWLVFGYRAISKEMHFQFYIVSQWTVSILYYFLKLYAYRVIHRWCTFLHARSNYKNR